MQRDYKNNASKKLCSCHFLGHFLLCILYCTSGITHLLKNDHSSLLIFQPPSRRALEPSSIAKHSVWFARLADLSKVNAPLTITGVTRVLERGSPVARKARYRPAKTSPAPAGPGSFTELTGTRRNHCRRTGRGGTGRRKGMMVWQGEE